MEPTTLPSGATATFINPDDMTNGARKPLVKLFTRLQGTGVVTGDPTKGAEDMTVDMSKIDESVIFDMTELTIMSLLASWSYPFGVSREALDDIPARDYDVLAEKAMEQFDGIMGVTTVKPGDAPADPEADPT